MILCRVGKYSLVPVMLNVALENLLAQVCVSVALVHALRPCGGHCNTSTQWRVSLTHTRS